MIILFIVLNVVLFKLIIKINHYNNINLINYCISNLYSVNNDRLYPTKYKN